MRCRPRGEFPRPHTQRRLAERQRHRWQGDETLDTTALVHEAYLRLVGDGKAMDPGSEAAAPDILEVFERLGGSVSHYFYGGAPGIPDEMATRMLQPGLPVLAKPNALWSSASRNCDTWMIDGR